MSTNTHQDSSPAAIVPGGGFKASIPELDPPVIDLVKSTASKELVRFTPDTEEGYGVLYRSTRSSDWETLTVEKTVVKAVKKAAIVQDFPVDVEEDPTTGQDNLSLNPTREGGLLVDSRDHFPIHLVKTAFDQFTPSQREFLIEAPDEPERSLFGEPGYLIRTRTDRQGAWETIHTAPTEIPPSVFLTKASKIIGVDVWTADMDRSITDFVQEVADEHPATPPSRNETPSDGPFY